MDANAVPIMFVHDLQIANREHGSTPAEETPEILNLVHHVRIR